MKGLSMPRITADALRDYSMADTFYETVAGIVDDERKRLKEGEQLRVYWIQPDGKQILVEEIAFSNPNMILLYGRADATSRLTIITHMSACSLVMRVGPSDPERPQRQLGFLGERGAGDEAL